MKQMMSFCIDTDDLKTIYIDDLKTIHVDTN